MATGDPVLTGTTLTPYASNDPNLVVLTRPDGRVVYHLGKLDPIPPADTNPALTEHLGPYTINGFSVPAHWWNARWTDRTNCPLKVINSPAQIVAAKRMFPYGPAGAAKIAAQPANVPYTIMGSSDVTLYEPTTGERQDIGLITDASAYFMLGGDPSHMLAWALVGETCPVYFRDQATDRPIDLTKYPQANTYDQPQKQGSPWLAKGPVASNGYSIFGGTWSPQQAHHPEYNYMAWLATGDMGCLESLQFHANFMLLDDAALSTASGAVPHGEYRGLAWTFRNLFMAHIATQDAAARGPLPAYLLPSFYFKTLLDNALAHYGQTIGPFHLVVDYGTFAPWQVDYMLTALAFGVLTGHSDWAPLYLSALQNAIDRLSGTSGYPPGWGGAYYLDSTQPTWAAAFNALQTNNQGSVSPTAAQLAALKADQYNAGVPMTGLEYIQTTRAVIAQAQYLDSQGILAVRKTFPNLDQCFAVVDRMVQSTGSMEARHAIAADPNVASTTVPPTGVTMSDPLTPLINAVTQIKADVAAEIAAIHARIVALLAAATNAGTPVSPTELQAQVDALSTLHTSLTADTAAIPTATS